jgi:hypothetical protein
MVAHTKPRVLASPLFPSIVQRDFPVKSRFLGRPRLLTRLYPLPAGRGELLALPSIVKALEESHFQLVMKRFSPVLLCLAKRSDMEGGIACTMEVSHA